MSSEAKKNTPACRASPVIAPLGAVVAGVALTGAFTGAARPPSVAADDLEAASGAARSVSMPIAGGASLQHPARNRLGGVRCRDARRRLPHLLALGRLRQPRAHRRGDFLHALGEARRPGGLEVLGVLV